MHFVELLNIVQDIKSFLSRNDYTFVRKFQDPLFDKGVLGLLVDIVLGQYLLLNVALHLSDLSNLNQGSVALIDVMRVVHLYCFLKF